jgi:hypothetical protein
LNIKSRCRYRKTEESFADFKIEESFADLEDWSSFTALQKEWAFARKTPREPRAMKLRIGTACCRDGAFTVSQNSLAGHPDLPSPVTNAMSKARAGWGIG